MNEIQHAVTIDEEIDFRSAVRKTAERPLSSQVLRFAGYSLLLPALYCYAQAARIEHDWSLSARHLTEAAERWQDLSGGFIVAAFLVRLLGFVIYVSRVTP